jgi:hypothetical protein
VKNKAITRILWFSRHKPKKEQLEELNCIFGDIEIVPVIKKVSTGKQVLDIIKINNCQEAVLVLPEKIIQQVVKEGFYPLRAVMERKFTDNGKTKFIHDHFERVVKFEMVTERIMNRKDV